MKLYYDFHIHTGLSPCGSEDMTPNNIVNMSLIKELDVIAITDHNSAGNVSSVMKAAEDTGLIVIGGMELETSEEIHCVCLFKTFNTLMEFEQKVKSCMPHIKNREDIYGRQIYYNSSDEEQGVCDDLLVTATNISLEDAIAIVTSLDGVLIPAHIDRSSYSIMSSFGFIPEEFPISCIELSMNCNDDEYLFLNRKKILKNYRKIKSSDAHYLENISERDNFLEIEGQPTVDNIIDLLKADLQI